MEQVKMKIFSLREVSFENHIPEGWVANESLNVGYAVKLQTDESKNAVRVLLSVTYSDSSGVSLLSYEIEAIFIVKNLSKLENKEEEIKKLTPTLLSTTLGAIRGMLVIKTQGTAFENTVLPLVPISKMLPNESDS